MNSMAQKNINSNVQLKIFQNSDSVFSPIIQKFVFSGGHAVNTPDIQLNSTSSPKQVLLYSYLDITSQKYHSIRSTDAREEITS